MNCIKFLKSTARDMFSGILVALFVICTFFIGIAIAAYKTNQFRAAIIDMAVANTPVKVEMVKLPVPEIDLGEQHILVEPQQ